MSAISQRLRILGTPQRKVLNEFAQGVAEGLGSRPKTLSPRFFYDRRGSQIFEQICRLPEYYLTRTETNILGDHADEIVGVFSRPPMIVELGSGSSEKTRLLLDSLFERSEEFSSATLSYAAIDISRSALEDSSRMLLDRYPELNMTAVAAEYREGLRLLSRKYRGPRLVILLGSNIGNMESDEAIEFLRHIRKSLSPADRCLISTDLLKDRDELHAAYDDAAGVTAAFNLNVLRRINRELGGNFDLEQFAHRAIFNEQKSRIEMHLASLRQQVVSIAALETSFCFEAGETIHSESSHKYSQSQIHSLALESQFRVGRQWLDEQKRFAVNLFVPS